MTLELLQRAGVVVDSCASLSDLLNAYHTVEERRIRCCPRTVHRTPEFDAAIAAGIVDSAVVAEIERKLREGKDVNGHVNVRSLDPAKPDGLLVDWQFHHLHLSNGVHPRNSRFRCRTDFVAFVHVAETDVYFVDVRKHGQWCDRTLFEVFARRFPQAAERFRLHGVSADPGITDQLVGRCRSLGVSYVVSAGGGAFCLGGFATGCGDSDELRNRKKQGANPTPGLNHQAHVRTERMIQHVTALQEATLANIEQIRREVPAIGQVSSPEFELVNHPDGFLIREKHTGQPLRIQWPSS